MGEDYSSPQKQDFGQSRYFTPTTKMMFAGLYARLIRNWYVCPDVRLVVAMLKIHCWLDASHRNAASGISPLVVSFTASTVPRTALNMVNVPPVPSEDCSRIRDGSTRRAAHPELHRNRASTFAWIDAGSVAVDRRQNHAAGTDCRAARAEGNVNRRTNWTASKVIGITCVTRSRSVGSGIERRSRTPGVVGNRDGLIQSSRPSHIRGQSVRETVVDDGVACTDRGHTRCFGDDVGLGV